jgi:hypothetical protein
MHNNQSTQSNYVVLINSDMYRELLEKPDKDKNLRALNYLLANTVAQQTDIEKRGIKSHLQVGQVEAPLLKLADAWHCDRKTVRAILDRLESLGMIARHSDRYTTIIDMVCLLGWRTSTGFVKNPLSAVDIHFDKPQAEVAAVAEPAPEPKPERKSEPIASQSLQASLFDDQTEVIAQLSESEN